MFDKTIIFLISTAIFLSCTPDVAADDPSKKPKQTTVTKSVDEVGNEIFIIKTRRNEGYTAYPSTLIKKHADEFYCEGYKIDALVVKREENNEVRSIDLTIKVNGDEIDLKTVLGSTPNLFGHSNIRTHFECVDHIVRIIIAGQRELENDKLADSAYIIDLLIDRNTGEVTGNLK